MRRFAIALLASAMFSSSANAATLLIQGFFQGILSVEDFSEPVSFEAEFDPNNPLIINGIEVLELSNLRAVFSARPNTTAFYSTPNFRFGSIPFGSLGPANTAETVFVFSPVSEEPEGEVFTLLDADFNPLPNAIFQTSLGSLQITGGSSISTRVIDSAVPEPATWAMMIGGFGLVGAAMRRGRVSSAITYA